MRERIQTSEKGRETTTRLVSKHCSFVRARERSHSRFVSPLSCMRLITILSTSLLTASRASASISFLACSLNSASAILSSGDSVLPLLSPFSTSRCERYAKR